MTSFLDHVVIHDDFHVHHYGDTILDAEDLNHGWHGTCRSMLRGVPVFAKKAARDGPELKLNVFKKPMRSSNKKENCQPTVRTPQGGHRQREIMESRRVSSIHRLKVWLETCQERTNLLCRELETFTDGPLTEDQITQEMQHWNSWRSCLCKGLSLSDTMSELVIQERTRLRTHKRIEKPSGTGNDNQVEVEKEVDSETHIASIGSQVKKGHYMARSRASTRDDDKKQSLEKARCIPKGEAKRSSPAVVSRKGLYLPVNESMPGLLLVSPDRPVAHATSSSALPAPKEEICSPHTPQRIQHVLPTSNTNNGKRCPLSASREPATRPPRDPQATKALKTPTSGRVPKLRKLRELVRQARTQAASDSPGNQNDDDAEEEEHDPSPSKWQHAYTPNQTRVYYYNRDTSEVTWTPPPKL